MVFMLEQFFNENTENMAQNKGINIAFKQILAIALIVWIPSTTYKLL